MPATIGFPLIFSGDSFSLAVPRFNVEDDARHRVRVGGLRKELNLGERCETKGDYCERCRHCDAADVFQSYLYLIL